MSTEKLNQDRIIVLGYDYNDARILGLRHMDVRANSQGFSPVSASAPVQTIQGGVGGMHVAKVYVTPSAHRGQHYEVARAALKRCLERSGGVVIHLQGEGGSFSEL